ncbi:aspartate kinase [Nisaea acidiphila]|uniref:Aspartokinase n=1 Tax=Nisaea acidiphila TaxID=1862145 RepID=A0A9J7AN13_9PROT|nr:aspartate kinase [Nisaea acidiphila]UUX48840.1 aspartate kinase [Nisaea acidiphila]
MLEPVSPRHTVEKIGGTSIANTDAVLKNVFLRAHTDADPYNRIFVVSAYAGMTDKLLEHKKTGAPGVFAQYAGAESDWAWGDALTRLADDMIAKNADVLADPASRRLADGFVRDRIEGMRNCLLDLQRLCTHGHFRLDRHLETVREMLAGLGEAHSAFNTSLLLKDNGINAVFVDLTGWRDDSEPCLDERIARALDGIDFAKELPIVTGYAHCNDGMVRRFDRGYTEVTFSRLAVVTEAREAVIHKEFHLSSADPKLVGEGSVRTIGQTNYDVADQLSNMGMEAVHPNAAKGLRQAGIPLRVRNTFDPADPGTMFREDYVSEDPRVEIVTGIKDLHMLEFFEQEMVGVKGYDTGILEALKRHNVRIVTKSSNANTITHYLAGSPKAVKRVIADLSEAFPTAEIATRKVALVSAIGSDMSVPELEATALTALAEAGIELLGVQRLSRKVDMMFILEEDRFEEAVKALHGALVETAENRDADRKAA